MPPSSHPPVCHPLARLSTQNDIIATLMLCCSQAIGIVYRRSLLAPRPLSLSRTGTCPIWRHRRIYASAAMTVAEGPAEVWAWIEDMNRSYESAHP